MDCHCNNQETKATIQKMEQTCSAWAVIPSYTVASSVNLQGLRNAFVHVSDINTTYYIDNQLRRIITWKGPVFQDNYDYENNPLSLVDQLVYDGANNRIIIFNQQGRYQIINTGADVPVPPDNEERIAKLEAEMVGVQHDIENLTELTESIPTDVVTSIDLTKSNGGLQISTHTRNTTDGTNTDSTLEGVIQPLLESGTNIKTINGESILGEGNIVITGGASEGGIDPSYTPNASYTSDNVNINFSNDVKAEITPAVGTAEGKIGKAGIMSAFQASQLEALAAAYEAEEKGTTLYEGTASVNNIELSESGFNYDHLIIVAQYMGMGSFALDQQVSHVFYPTDTIKAFQMNATDITTGNTPMVQLIQDIWSITDDGMELELVSALKATVNSETEVEPDTTSHFTITKVVGFGKKEITG